MKYRCETQMRRISGQDPVRRGKVRAPVPPAAPKLTVVTEATQPPEEPESPLLHPKETDFTNQVAAVIDDSTSLSPGLTREQARGMHRAYETTKRLNLSLQVTEIKCRIETLTDIHTGKTYRASTEHVGPAGSSLTWHAIAVLVKLVVCFALPMNRVAKMIGHKGFGSAKIFRTLASQALLLRSIYLHLADQLADVSILTGDDTPTKVVEVDEEKKREEDGVEPDKKPREDGEKPSVAGIFVKELDEALGWQAAKKRGEGPKRTLQVSFVMGRTIPADLRSTIYFFRTHRGQLGNLLTKILKKRKTDEVFTIQGDMSPANLPETSRPYIVAGCGAHARRPFWRHRDQDEELCYFMLRGFNLLAFIERMIDYRGRNRYWVTLYRRRARMIWGAMLARCRVAVTGVVDNPRRYHMLPGDTVIQWPPNTKLYEACMYVINHYEALTRYLSDPRLEYTNNRSERSLRTEVQMLVTSKFRKTRYGRAVLDILRTITATCNVAKVDLEDYLRFVYKHRDQIDRDPKNFTPHAFRLRLDAEALDPTDRPNMQVNTHQ